MYRTHYPQMWSAVNLCFALSGWTSGTRHRRPQGADGPADQGGAGALGVWWHGLTGQPPAASHTRRTPAPPLLFPVHRWPRRHHERERPRMKTWPSKEHFHPGENFSIGYLLRYKSVTEVGEWSRIHLTSNPLNALKDTIETSQSVYFLKDMCQG